VLMDQSSRDNTLVGVGPPPVTPGDAVSPKSSRDKPLERSPEVPGEKGSPINRFQFVADHQQRYGVKRLCKVLGVSRSSYYYWQSTVAARAARDAADVALVGRIRAVHAEHDGTYGAPRITAELRDAGLAVNRKRVARVMRRFGVQGLRLRRRTRTTVPDPAAAKAPDLIGRDFTAPAVNQRYVGSGSRRESHPPAPTEPCVTVSRYTALATLITRTRGSIASAQTFWGIAA
ncbi:transposase, partial [Micromonospora sp. MP36]